jgi:hypothetical protein
MTLVETIKFLNRDCKNQKHFLCTGSWHGFDFAFNCECQCHEKKDDVADSFGRQDTAASGQNFVEVTGK